MGFFKQSEIKKRYDIGDTLGSGNFATVKRATSKQPTQGIPTDVAIKIIDKAKVDDMQDIRREVEIMQDIDHPGIIKLYEIFDEPKKMHLVMELVTGGELFDRIVAKGQYTEADASKAIRALSEALGYLHSKQIVHRDIKPENILCAGPEDAQLKIADFGLARVLSKGDMMKVRPPARPPARAAALTRLRRCRLPAQTACGTPGYVAPEILRNQGYDSGAVDMWSLGVILYILLCGFPPFYEEELPALFEQIMQASWRLSRSGSASAPDLLHLLHVLHVPHVLHLRHHQPPCAAGEVRLSFAVVGWHLPGLQGPRLQAARAQPEQEAIRPTGAQTTHRPCPRSRRRRCGRSVRVRSAGCLHKPEAASPCLRRRCCLIRGSAAAPARRRCRRRSSRSGSSTPPESSRTPP